MSGASGFIGDAGRTLRDPGVGAAEIRSLEAERLERVETLFRENIASPLRLVDEIGEFVADGGGKRVRPTLHLLMLIYREITGHRSSLESVMN